MMVELSPATPSGPGSGSMGVEPSGMGSRTASYGAGLDAAGNYMWKSPRRKGRALPCCWIHVVDEATCLRAPEPVKVEAIGDLKEQLEAVAVAGGNKRKSFVIEKGVEESWDEVKRVTASTMKQFSEFDWTFSLSRFDNSYENEHVGAYVFGSVGAFFGGIICAVFNGMTFWTARGIKRASDSGYRKCARAYYNFYLTLVGASACMDDGTDRKLVRDVDRTPRLQRVGEVGVVEETPGRALAEVVAQPFDCDAAQGEGLFVKAKPLLVSTRLQDAA